MSKIKFNFSPKTKPLPHQPEAIIFLKNKKNIALFDEQGLGKSKIVIDVLCNDLARKTINCALIVCKKTLLKTWKDEIKKHSYLRVAILGGNKRIRRRSFLLFAHFYLINYESFIQELSRIKDFLSLYKFAVVLDESTKIKNPESKITKAILEIKNYPFKKIIITGMPIANKPEDIWAQIFFLDGGKLLGANFKNFKNIYKVKLKGRGIKKYEDVLSVLNKKLDNISIRRTKCILELPQKVYYEISVNLKGRQKKLYEKLRKELYLEIKNAKGEIVNQKIDSYLVKLLRLTQIASNPAMFDDNYKETPSKFIKLDELVGDIIKKHEKVIIWTIFIKNIIVLRKRYDKFGALRLCGEVPIEERNNIIEKFLKNEENKILIANPAVAKEGLTLTSANNAIYLDRNFKMDDYIQSQDRIHRIGQEKKCNIIKIIATNTIDEYTDEIIDKKYSLAKYILGDVNKIEEKTKQLTREDLLKILG